MNRATIYRLLPETQANHEKLMGICGALPLGTPMSRQIGLFAPG